MTIPGHGKRCQVAVEMVKAHASLGQLARTMRDINWPNGKLKAYYWDVANTRENLAKLIRAMTAECPGDLPAQVICWQG